MCFYDITRYSCSAEAASLIEHCVMVGSCLPHIQQIRDTSAVCDLCAVACRWSEHQAIVQWLAMEREELGSITEGDEDIEEAVSEDGEDGSTDEDLVEGTKGDREGESAGDTDDEDDELIKISGAKFRLSRISSEGEKGGLRARRATF